MWLLITFCVQGYLWMVEKNMETSMYRFCVGFTNNVIVMVMILSTIAMGTN